MHGEDDSKSKKRVLVCNTDYLHIEGAIDEIFAHFKKDLAGKKVFVKPNILGPYKPERAITTNPSVVRAVVKKLLSMGAKVVVGDNPGHVGYGISQKAASIAGIVDASEGCYKNIGSDSVKVKIRGQEVCVTKELFDCDVFISLPKLKTHMYTIMTGAVKNSYGLLVGKEKSKLHQLFWKPEDFAEVISNVYSIRVPDLIITDAIICMEGDGPNSPTLRTVNRLLAADNGVALDVVACSMMGIKPEEVAVLRNAHLSGLGPITMDEIDVKGDCSAIPNFKLPITYKKLDVFRQAIVDGILGRGKLRINGRKCVRCHMCVHACPQQAIGINEKKKNLPVIDHSKCILCFCCKEMCQYDAIRLLGLFSFLQKTYNGMDAVLSRIRRSISILG